MVDGDRCLVGGVHLQLLELHLLVEGVLDLLGQGDRLQQQGARLVLLLVQGELHHLVVGLGGRHDGRLGGLDQLQPPACGLA